MPIPESTAPRTRILAVLRSSANPMSTREVANAIDAHPNSARLQLDALVDEGIVERELKEPVGRGRPAHLYRSLPTMDRARPGRLDALAKILVAGLGREPEGWRLARAAGRVWGGELAAESVGESAGEQGIVGLHQMLDDFGFEPDPLTESEHRSGRINLRHCPFLELTDERRDVVCAVHLGLMEGYVEDGEPRVEIESLEPFEAPDCCVARWREISASASGATSGR